MTGRRRTWRKSWTGATGSCWISSSAGTVISLLLAATAFAQDAREIVRKSLDLDNRNHQLARQYTFLQREDQRELDGEGRVKKRTVRTWDVTLLEGEPYRRLIERDDKPLPPKEEKEQQEKLQKNIDRQSKLTEADRARRRAEIEEHRKKAREPYLEIPDAFDFRLAGEETVEGRGVWAVEATPRPGFRPKSRLAKVFPKMRGRLWIDRQDYQWVKIEAEVLNPISFGWFLAKVDRGTHMAFESARVNDEVWLPRRIEVAGSARLLVKRVRTEIDITFRNYRKFQADSRVVDGSVVPQSDGGIDAGSATRR